MATRIGVAKTQSVLPCYLGMMYKSIGSDLCPTEVIFPLIFSLNKLLIPLRGSLHCLRIHLSKYQSLFHHSLSSPHYFLYLISFLYEVLIQTGKVISVQFIFSFFSILKQFLFSFLSFFQSGSNFSWVFFASCNRP